MGVCVLALYCLVLSVGTAKAVATAHRTARTARTARLIKTRAFLTTCMLLIVTQYFTYLHVTRGRGV